jgi:hypothetical protein
MVEAGRRGKRGKHSSFAVFLLLFVFHSCCGTWTQTLNKRDEARHWQESCAQFACMQKGVLELLTHSSAQPLC